MMNFFGACNRDPFYFEDDAWEVALQAYIDAKDPGAAMDAYPQKSLEELSLLYQEARKIEPGVALELVQAAQSDEERYFYAHILNMNLQRAQKLAIERNLF